MIPTTPEPAATLSQALGPFARRVRSQRALTVGVWLLGLAMPLLALRPDLAWGILALTGLCWGAVWGWPLAPDRLAREADRVLGLNAVCDTARHLAAQGHPAAQAVALDAGDALAAAPLPPLRRPGLHPLVVGGALAALLAVAQRSSPPPPGPSVPDPVGQALEELEAQARREGDAAVVAAIQALRGSRPVGPAPTLRPGEDTPRSPGGSAPEARGAAEALDQARALADATAASENPALRAQGERAQAQLDALEALDEALRHQAPPSTTPAAGAAGASAASEGFGEGDGAGGQGSSPPGGAALRAEIDGGAAPQSPQEPNLHAWDQAREQLMQAVAETIREDLLNTNRDRGTAGPSRQAQNGLENTAETGAERRGAQPRPPPEGASMTARPPGASTATDALQARIERPGEAPNPGSGGGESKGDSPSVATAPGTEDADPGEGAGDAVSGGLDPAALDDEGRARALDLIAQRAVSGGQAGFEQELGGWFTEAERALAEEDLPPLMEGLVRAYLTSVRESE